MNVKSKIENLKVEKRAFINGSFCEPMSKKWISKSNSAEGSHISGIADCGIDDVDYAVDSAKSAFESGVWSEKSINFRKETMLKLASLMEENKEELALLDTYETGRAFKNYYEDSIPKAIECIRYFSESIDKIYDEAVPYRGKDSGIITRMPVGVVGLITPWNDPLVVSSWKFAPALLMGNSVVIKPAEQSSLSILKVAELAQEAGIPEGVFNVIPGTGEVAGKALAMHMDVRVVSFTGSSEIGKKILQYSGLSNMKKVYLECGGKSPYIVSDKCKNIEEAAEVLAKNMFYNQGQICSAPSRVIVDKKIAGKFIETLKKEAEKYVPGNPYDSDNVVGCVVNQDQYNKVLGYIDIAKSEGGEVYQAKTILPKSDNALCIQPTIISKVNNNCRVSQEEIFGPVVVIIESSNLKEAVKIANDTKYGLAAAIWSDDINEVNYATRSLQAGLVHVNSYGDDDNSAPFGGVKESGIGKDKSVYAFDDFCEIKTIWTRYRNI